MQDLPTIVVVFGALILVVDHLRRLFTAVSLNHSIREAIKHHPASVPLLLEKVEARHPFPLALGGWVFLGLGLVMGAMLALAEEQQDREASLATAFIAALGIGLLIADRWVSRPKRPLP